MNQIASVTNATERHTALSGSAIKCGDCIAEMAKLEERSVHLAFADPPFNIGYDYDIYDDRKATDDYLGWSKQWIKEVCRVLRPDGTFWLAIGDEYAAELKVLCTRELGLHCRSWVVWFYTFGVHCTKKFTRSHAHLFHFVKDTKRFTFHMGRVRVPSAREIVYRDKRAAPEGRSPDDTWMATPELPPDTPMFGGFVLRPQDIPDRFPSDSDTWYFSRVAGTFTERLGWHGCQMPEQLLGRIIRACSNEGEVVLDPFGGSGTTLAVAKKLGRRYLGIELSPSYATQIEQRLDGIRVGEALTGPEKPELSSPGTARGRSVKADTIVGSARRTRRRQGEPQGLFRRPVVDVARPREFDDDARRNIVEAFQATNDGSIDRMLADPRSNQRFLDECALRGAPGTPRDWNHLLLTMRKCGRGLVHKAASQPREPALQEYEPYSFASEIAWRLLLNRTGQSLDTIFSDPSLAAEFDAIAASIAPGFTAVDYRWAALSLRKRASKGEKSLTEHGVRYRATRTGLRVDEIPGLPVVQANYIVSVGDTALYSGFSSRLPNCPFLRLEVLQSAAEKLNVSGFSESRVAIEYQSFDAAARDSGCWLARRLRIIRKSKPLGNVDNSQSAA